MLIEVMQRVLLNRCRETQPITAEFTMTKIGDETNFYLEESSCVCFTNSEIGRLMLSVLGINPCGYENIEVQFDLDVFAGTILEGDSEDGSCLEWFSIETDEDLNGEKYLRCVYGRSRNVKEI